MKAIDQAGEAVCRLCGPGYTHFLASHHKTAWEESPLVPMRKQAMNHTGCFLLLKCIHFGRFHIPRNSPSRSSLISLRITYSLLRNKLSTSTWTAWIKVSAKCIHAFFFFYMHTSLSTIQMKYPTFKIWVLKFLKYILAHVSWLFCEFIIFFRERGLITHKYRSL